MNKSSYFFLYLMCWTCSEWLLYAALWPCHAFCGGSPHDPRHAFWWVNLALSWPEGVSSPRAIACPFMTGGSLVSPCFCLVQLECNHFQKLVIVLLIYDTAAEFLKVPWVLNIILTKNVAKKERVIRKVSIDLVQDFWLKGCSKQCVPGALSHTVCVCAWITVAKGRSHLLGPWLAFASSSSSAYEEKGNWQTPSQPHLH